LIPAVHNTEAPAAAAATAAAAAAAAAEGAHGRLRWQAGPTHLLALVVCNLLLDLGDILIKGELVDYAGKTSKDEGRSDRVGTHAWVCVQERSKWHVTSVCTLPHSLMSSTVSR
jgi:hypothetical protein